MTDIVDSKRRGELMGGIRLTDSDERDDGQDDGSPSHGANAAGAAVPEASLPRCAILRERRSILMSEGWLRMVGSRAPACDTDVR